MTAARIMPERVLYGNQGQQWIMNLIDNRTDGMRPIVPGERVLGRFILPPFQRNLVWTERQKIRLIESLYMGLPVGSIIWNQTSWGEPTDGWLLDGQQRISTIMEYVQGRFRVSGRLYPGLPEIEKRHFKRIGINMIESNARDPAFCQDIYERLAYGGTPHQ